MRIIRLYPLSVVSQAFLGKFLFFVVVLLSGFLYESHSVLSADKTKSNSNIALSQEASKVFEACASMIEPTRNNSPDATLLENTDDEFNSLKKLAEGTSSSLSVLIDGSISLAKYFYTPASCRYIIFSVFRI